MYRSPSRSAARSLPPPPPRRCSLGRRWTHLGCAIGVSDHRRRWPAAIAPATFCATLAAACCAARQATATLSLYQPLAMGSRSLLRDCALFVPPWGPWAQGRPSVSCKLHLFCASATCCMHQFPKSQMGSVVMGEGSDPRKIVDRGRLKNQEKQQPGTGSYTTTTVLHITPAVCRPTCRATQYDRKKSLYESLLLDRGALFRFCH